MKKKIKLRDMTEEQFFAFKHSDSCIKKSCDDCLFHYTSCSVMERCWAKHKDLYSDKFLDQEVEIEVPDILTPEEKEYLKAFIAPFREKIEKIEMASFGSSNEMLNIHYLSNGAPFSLLIPVTPSLRFSGIGQCDSFTLEELGL